MCLGSTSAHAATLWPLAGAEHGLLCRMQPDWAGLPIELWHQTLLCLSDLLEDDVSRWRQLAAAALVCRTLRDAVLGPGEGPVWRSVTFTSSHPGLDARQSRQLNRLLTSRGCHAHDVTVVGGGWELEELRAAAVSLTRQVAHLKLLDVNVAGEAACLSSALSGCAARFLVYKGSWPLMLPALLRTLRLQDTSVQSPRTAAELQEAKSTQSHAQRLLRSLQPLSRLVSLRFTSFEWRMCEADIVQIAAWCPQLEVLTLDLAVNASLGLHAVEALSRLPVSVRLVPHLVAQDSSLTSLLQALHGIRLFSIWIVEVGAYRLSPADERHLARCRLTSGLRLQLHAREPADRLQRLLRGVTYGPNDS